MAETKPAKRKPVFKKVEQLKPDTKGHTLTLKVVSSKMVLQKARPDGIQVRQMRIAECVVGDETGTIIFTARNDQGIVLILAIDLTIVLIFDSISSHHAYLTFYASFLLKLFACKSNLFPFLFFRSF